VNSVECGWAVLTFQTLSRHRVPPSHLSQAAAWQQRDCCRSRIQAGVLNPPPWPRSRRARHHQQLDGLEIVALTRGNQGGLSFLASTAYNGQRPWRSASRTIAAELSLLAASSSAVRPCFEAA